MYPERCAMWAFSLYYIGLHKHTLDMLNNLKYNSLKESVTQFSLE